MFFRLSLLAACATALQVAISPGCVHSQRCPSVAMMGRKFENNKVKMAKTALAYAKKASYIGKKVVVAVKAGGDDPSVNRQLQAVMAEGDSAQCIPQCPVTPHSATDQVLCPHTRTANALNVPKDVITKNIKRAMDTDTANFDELVYEAYGHGGVGLIISCLSDNKNRAVEQVSTAIKKENCKIAASGSVAFNFQKKGRLTINTELTEDELLELAIEGGCEGDVELQKPDTEGRGDGDEVKCVAITEATELGLLQSALQEADHPCTGILVSVPLTTVECGAEDEELNFKVLDRLEELDDVSFIEHNMAVSA
jgi:YebC/PmpR family DNA-binding regulatory protein